MATTLRLRIADDLVDAVLNGAKQSGRTAPGEVNYILRGYYYPTPNPTPTETLRHRKNGAKKGHPS